MYYVDTALGRSVPLGETGTVRQDLILKILFDYRMSPFNSANTPMTLPLLSGAARLDPKTTEAIAGSLAAANPTLVEKVQFQGTAFRITDTGVVYVQNVPRGLVNAL